MPAPSSNSYYVPGCWVYQESRYFWRPGVWVPYRPGWVWVPARYVWTTCGYVFVDGYWDYPLDGRGLLFAPVYVSRPAFAGWSYTPRFVVSTNFLLGALFVLRTEGTPKEKVADVTEEAAPPSPPPKPAPSMTRESRSMPASVASRTNTCTWRRAVLGLTDAGIPAYISDTAGTYLCNQTLYTTLHAVAGMVTPPRVGFLHVPLLPAMVAASGLDQPSMDFLVMQRAVHLTLEVLAAD